MQAMVTVSQPKAEPLPSWIERTIRLPAGSAAEPGPIKLYPYQKGIAAAIGDPAVEPITVIKSARIGYTALLTASVAHFVVREQSPILVLMPTEADCRDYMVSDLEPLFLDSTEITDRLPMPHPGRSDRNTLPHRLFSGGSLKIVAGKAPRNLRRHTARVLLIDEARRDRGERGRRPDRARREKNAQLRRQEDHRRVDAARRSHQPYRPALQSVRPAGVRVPVP
jgi:phage terminase large subunit GpA-like protein